jgi:tRNA (adenine57-N1/adenine58-N1)-methyltransferase
MIDIPAPWELIPAAYKSLKPGYSLSLICPTYDQLIKSVLSLRKYNFTNIETLECFTRRILVREGKTRPEQRIPSHTGFIVFASKINQY